MTKPAWLTNPRILALLRSWSEHARKESAEDVGAALASAADLIERLTAERDHARRLHCYAVAGTMQGRAAEDVAKSLGWDCFKEER